MRDLRGFLLFGGLMFLLQALSWEETQAQEKFKLSYSSADTTNAVYFVAQERNFYKKHGLDAELIFIPQELSGQPKGYGEASRHGVD